jgi:hypothetical protein
MLSMIRNLHLSVCWVGAALSSLDEPFVTQCLKPYGHMFDHIKVHVVVSEESMPAAGFAKAAAACKSLDLTVSSSDVDSVDISGLQNVADSLVKLKLVSKALECSVAGVTTLSSLTRLRSLESNCRMREDACVPLAALTSLESLNIFINAHGGPAPVSALTGLSYLQLSTQEHAYFQLSSLHPLSELQQLEGLHLSGCCISVTSLHGLAGLSKLTDLSFKGRNAGLASLDGLNPNLTRLELHHMQALDTLDGLSALVSLRELSLSSVFSSPSLSALLGLSSLQCLRFGLHGLTSLEGTLPGSLRTLTLDCCPSLQGLSGIQELSSLQSLIVIACQKVTSLQPVAEVAGGLTRLSLNYCHHIHDEVLELPNLHPSAKLLIQRCGPILRQLVVAGSAEVPVADGWPDGSLKWERQWDGMGFLNR